MVYVHKVNKPDWRWPRSLLVLAPKLKQRKADLLYSDSSLLHVWNLHKKKMIHAPQYSIPQAFFLDACLEVIGGWFLRYLEFLEGFVEFLGHFVEFFGKFIEFLATLLEFLIFLYLFSPKPMILLTFPIFPWEKD